MTYFTLHRILALANIFILLILTADNFLLPEIHVREIYDHRSSVETRNSYRSSRYSTDYINTVSGETFQIPANWQRTNIGLNEGDTFYIDKSPLFRQPVTLDFRWRGTFASMRMGVFNYGYWGPLLAIYIMVVSLIHLLPWRLIRKDDLNERLIFSGSALIPIVLFFYFYH